MFLAQSEIEDSNADLCAGRYYYEAMKAHGATAEHVPWCAQWLAGLAQVGRLAMTVMMLDRATLGQLRAMFDALEGLAGWKDEGSPSLRATFGVA